MKPFATLFCILTFVVFSTAYSLEIVTENNTDRKLSSVNITNLCVEAKSAGIQNIERIEFNYLHPTTGVIFRISGDTSITNRKWQVKQFRGSLNGENGIHYSELDYRYFIEFTINGATSHISVNESGLNIAEDVLRKFYTQPHKFTQRTDEGWKIPADYPLARFSFDEEKKEYRVSFRISSLSGEVVTFKIKRNKIYILKIMTWVS